MRLLCMDTSLDQIETVVKDASCDYIDCTSKQIIDILYTGTNIYGQLMFKN